MNPINKSHLVDMDTHAFKKSIQLLVVLALLFTITNKLPFSLLFVPLMMFLPILLLKQRSLPLFLILLLSIATYFFLWTLFVDPLAFFQYDFYRRDGNFFVTFTPLILLSILCLRVDIERIFTLFLYFATSINLFSYLLHLINPNFAGYAAERNIYLFHFITHNAAGGFLANLLALSVAIFLKKRSLLHLSFVVINSMTLLATHSRGSVLAFFGACVAYLFFKERFSKWLVWIITAATLILLFFCYPIWQDLGSPMHFFDPDTQEGMQSDLEFERSETFLDRALYLWPRAFDLFVQSPIIGVGFGAFNDIPYRLEGIDHLVMINKPQEYIYSDAHAHHTFLHIMAETGVVGLFLFIAFLVSLRNYILKIEDKLIKDTFMLMFWISVWSSMTEHRWFTPSQMLPFMLLLGLYVGSSRATILYPLKRTCIKFQ